MAISFLNFDERDWEKNYEKILIKIKGEPNTTKGSCSLEYRENNI